MSRSRRKTPICGWSTAVSNKPFKIQENRRHRRTSKQILKKHEDDTLLHHHRKYGDEWDSPRDGKQYFGDMLSCTLPGWFYTVWMLTGTDIEELEKERKEDFKRLMRK